MLGGKDSVDDQFMEMIDDLVVMSEKDSELAEGLRWIDVQSQRNGLTFYEMAMIILRKHMAERRAKEWLKGKFNNSSGS
jgi:tRNA(His) 5'-end guanylyltransferase